MKVLSFILAGLLLSLQYPLWIGKGSWLRVWDLDRSLAQQKDQNAKLKARNDALDAEVRDLKQGLEAVEERARLELGMIKKDEVFYQVVTPDPSRSPSSRTSQTPESSSRTSQTPEPSSRTSQTPEPSSRTSQQRQ